MADSQILTVSYGGIQVTGQVVNGQIQVSVPAEVFLETDGRAKALDFEWIKKIIELFLQLLPLILGGL